MFVAGKQSKIASALLISALLCGEAAADCLPFDEARKHLGENRCITGRVVRVKQGDKGVHYLDFCDDFRLCPFMVVIFPGDLKSVGDVRQLQGRVVEIHGQVREYDGRAEIILQEYHQISGSGVKIPPLPKDYDVGKKGKYSAGTFSHPKAAKQASAKRQPAKIPADLPEDPEP
jgi:DNA/RNA endonuclease YhcR with UshA esterase domain